MKGGKVKEFSEDDGYQHQKAGGAVRHGEREREHLAAAAAGCLYVQVKKKKKKKPSLFLPYYYN